MAWFWLSFADPHRREDAFLGVTIVEGHGDNDEARIDAALDVARQRGINPGGEVGIQKIPVDFLPPLEWRNRLLSEAEVDELNDLMWSQLRERAAS